MRVALLVALLAASAATSCEQNAPKEATPAPAPSAISSAELDAFLKDTSQPLTVERYEHFLLRLEDCKLTQRGIDSKCEAHSRLRKARNRATPPKQLASMSSALGQKLIRHRSPAIRYQAAQLLKAAIRDREQATRAVLTAAKTEQHPAVLSSMVRVVGARHKQDPEVKALLLRLADHDDEAVRQEAMSWFLTRFGEGQPDTFDKVLEKLDKDPSLKLRKFLCSRLYGSSDERAIAVFERVLRDSDAPTQLRDGCWQGTIGAWTGFPKPEKPSKRAYELTLEILEQKPRGRHTPPWTGLRNLRAAKTDYLERDKFGRKWLKKVEAWYDKPRLMKALLSVVNDKAAFWMARTSAIDVLDDLGFEPEKLEALEQKYEKATGDDVHVRRKLHDLLKAKQSAHEH